MSAPNDEISQWKRNSTLLNNFSHVNTKYENMEKQKKIILQEFRKEAKFSIKQKSRERKSNIEESKNPLRHCFINVYGT